MLCEDSDCMVRRPESGVRFCLTHSALYVSEAFVRSACSAAGQGEPQAVHVGAAIAAALRTFRAIYPGVTVRTVTYELEVSD